MDAVSTELAASANLIERIGKISSIIIGIVILIIAAICTEITDGVSLIIGLALAIIVPFSYYILFYVIALLLGALASIVRFTRLSANIAMYENNFKPVKEGVKKQEKPITVEEVVSEVSIQTKIDTVIEHINEEKLEYIDVTCPVCNKELSFIKGTKTSICPFCDHKIDFLK